MSSCFVSADAPLAQILRTIPYPCFALPFLRIPAALSRVAGAAVADDPPPAYVPRSPLE
ncbi:MAG: hypothetical protein PVS2B2_19430 [Candidatus Acidiferrum sp.]